MSSPTQEEILATLQQKRRSRNMILQRSAIVDMQKSHPDTGAMFAFSATRQMMRKSESQLSVKEILSDYEFSQKINSGLKLAGDAVAAYVGPVVGDMVGSAISAGAKAGIGVFVNDQKAWLYDRLQSNSATLLGDRVRNYVSNGGNIQDLYKEEVINAADRYLGLDEVAELLDKNIPESAKPLMNEIMIRELKKAVVGGYLENLAKDQAQDYEIGKIASEMIAIQHSVDTQINEFNNTIDSVGKSLEAINGTISDVRKRIEKNEGTIEEHDRDIRFLSDYMYGKMSPEEKLGAIKANVIKLRPEEREKELQKLTALAEQESLKRSISKLMSNGQDMVNIFNNFLGPDNELSQGLGKVVEIGSTVANAYLQYQTGNVIGAVSSISNLMGSARPDPAAARHAEIMQTLTKVMQKLDQMDEKLNQLIEGQRLLFEGQQLVMDTLNKLGEQMYEMQYKLTDDILYNRKLIAQLFIDKLNRIQALYWNFGVQIINVNNGVVPEYRELCKILYNASPDSQEWELFNTIFQSLPTDAVHPFLFSRTHIENAGATDSDNGFKKDSIQASVDQFNSLRELLMEVAGPNADEYLLFALNPVATCGGIERRIHLYSDGSMNNPYSEKLSVLIRDLISVSYLKECVEALCNTHFLYPIVCERRGEKLLPYYEFIALDEWQTSLPRDWLFSAKKIVDIAIVQQALFMGDAFIPSLYPLLNLDLTNVDGASKTARLFKVIYAKESVLGYNLMLYTITRRLREQNGFDSITSYKYAYEHGDASELHIALNTRPKGLNGLGGNRPQWDIVRKPGLQGWWINLGDTMVRLPNTEEIAHQRFAIPSSLALLQQLRAHIAIQEQSYSIPESMSLSVGENVKWDALVGCLFADTLGMANAPLFLP